MSELYHITHSGDKGVNENFFGGEEGTGKREQGMGNGERGMGNGERQDEQDGRDGRK